MKYELSFLNNIHDSMEMVNVELDPIFWICLVRGILMN